jgi:hypothetical protein
MVDGEAARRCRVRVIESAGGIMATPEIALLALIIAGLAAAPVEAPAPAAAAVSTPTTEAIAAAAPADKLPA